MTLRSIGLSPKEMSILKCIRDGELPRKVVAKTMGMAQSELTRLLKSLESKGMLVVRKNGMSSTVAFSDMKHALLLRRILNEYGHMRLEGILSLASLRVLTSLAVSPVSTRAEMQSFSGVSPRTLQTVLSKFRELGVVRVRSRGVYEISDRFAPFTDFVRELSEYSNQKEARNFSPDSVVIWERGSDFIVRTKSRKENDDFRTTAFSAFGNYGVPLILDWHYYYHTHGKWRRTADEVFLQSLAIRPLGSREMTAMKMLWQRKSLWRNLIRLRARAKVYGLTDELEGIVANFQNQENEE
ncbi:MAG: hypothetical protein LN409_02895 [Candidatus Thermoplasmatota archaeon]|nr:hypothetical protein [Candidatus Thermoplasmatota archaeon]